MEAYKYFPVANDRMGIIWTLSSIKDACIVEFGPAGTTHYAIEGIGSLNGEDEAKVYSTHMDQSDVTFGKYERLEKAILEIDKNISPKYIFVMASSISSIIGADIISVCDTLKDLTNAKLIPITTGGLKDDYNTGVEYALELLACEIVKDNNIDINKYNILGANIDKYNYLSDVKEVERIMNNLFDKKLNTTFTANTSIDEIEEASKASLNIVIRKEALKAAEYMKEKYNIPYIYKNLYGLKNTIKFIESIKAIDGYILNEVRYNEEINFVKKNMFSIKRKFYFYDKTKDCAVFGDYDTVIGISDMLNEFGFNVDRKEILYKTNCEDEDVLISTSELDRMKYLKDKELLMLLGDGPSLDMVHNSKLDLQVSNPNLEKINIYPYTPFVGFRGCLYIMEKILNIKA
ncbi:nitrogenase iron-molybdenum cofactor biosynthesis protein NifE [[Clostridium] sordellii]|uniref:Nitrogenase iron-molybdenum cofactor biosynthesis protein NifE n=1 Tax=Paraclostridium sordellii TaxID=1505 RepID=A0ABM9RM50_PARSO|nr:nitrogenase component 1 [Paeniclostridium sordellii]CEJ72860.1 nitrogenase iron-molybdenum cofactor biosynthesis protein NifE [[Clostridium] sordellii] [Paeniclostridium sordellii]CEN68413.1 nitrogenase iron-molybdenum cofactor biosynthesis protein NifE [[Clostridium] sordellii] [Paeniclostridium sordellii]CEN71680.1 nitrogenase iron-molybdenum cofactor biosynthesis protein NifE [[Clostridium] sordellii] [Paeniclostridium sordellii]CEO22107.1 nitrogenase iron-molybdenum cofactor biosynthesis